MPVALLNKIHLKLRLELSSLANAIDYGRVNTVGKRTKTPLFVPG